MTCNHEWGGVVIPGPVNRIVIDQCESCGELRLPDAAPPAQAVDLGQFRELVTTLVDRCGDDLPTEQFTLAGRLLNLIDGKA